MNVTGAEFSVFSSYGVSGKYARALMSVFCRNGETLIYSYTVYDLKLSNQLNIHELFNRILFFFTTLDFERWGEDFDGVRNDLERGRRDF